MHEDVGYCICMVSMWSTCCVFLKTASTMTAIKHALQRDIFTPNDERLLGIVNVCKAGKKKKNCFLCATGNLVMTVENCYRRLLLFSGIVSKISWSFVPVTTERPVQVKVVKVKKSDKGDFYKRQQTWELRDLTEVDAKDASKVRSISSVITYCTLLLFCCH